MLSVKKNERRFSMVWVHLPDKIGYICTFRNNKNMRKYCHLIVICLLLASCASKKRVDCIVHHAVVYTVDSAFSVQEAFAIKDGKFVEIGTNEAILQKYSAPQSLDVAGKAIFPGFMDPHCHFLWYGKLLNEVQLQGTNSWTEVIQKVTDFRKDNPDKTWIIGMGWDQNTWVNKQYPSKDTLDVLFPDVPVCLRRIDGHALIANQKALDLAGVTENTKVEGGEIVKIDGKLTGVLIDNAMEFVNKVIPEPTDAELTEALKDAQKNCFAVGLTSVGDAGLSKKEIELIDLAQKKNELQMRMYAMVLADKPNLDHFLARGFYQTDNLNVRSFKVFADGALGSRGACLLHPYHDAPQSTGFLLRSPAQFDSLVGVIAAKGFQINTHCIGDSTNRTLINIYAKHLKGNRALRWRIEHAQIVSPSDQGLFGTYGILPSVQPTHATSDMKWAGDRLGEERLKTAYAYKNLLKSAGLIACGSDFPIEDINPLYGFYAAVVRRDKAFFPPEGFQMENAITRIEALKGMTIWAAYAQFEEAVKGSIEPQKFADFVIVEKDIMKVPDKEVREVKVKATFIGGQRVFGKE